MIALPEPMELPAIVRKITAEMVRAYAEVSGDSNPLHNDQGFASGTRFGAAIAHGMLAVALVDEMLAAAFGQAWARGGKLRVRFMAPVYVGDEVTTFGMARGIATGADGHLATCRVGMKDSRERELVTGVASVRLPTAQGGT